MLFLYPASENPHNALGPKVKRRYFCGLRFGNLHQLSGPRQVCLSVGASSNSPDGGVTAYPQNMQCWGNGVQSSFCDETAPFQWCSSCSGHGKGQGSSLDKKKKKKCSKAGRGPRFPGATSVTKDRVKLTVLGYCLEEIRA